jgi:hypothetical protein
MKRNVIKDFRCVFYQNKRNIALNPIKACHPFARHHQPDKGVHMDMPISSGGHADSARAAAVSREHFWITAPQLAVELGISRR